jgi:hypothetical protein
VYSNSFILFFYILEADFPNGMAIFVISYLHRGTEFRRGEIRWFRGLFTLYGELAFALIASLWHDAEGVV